MGLIKKVFIVLMATVSVAVGSLAVVPDAYAMENNMSNIKFGGSEQGPYEVLDSILNSNAAITSRLTIDHDYNSFIVKYDGKSVDLVDSADRERFEIDIKGVNFDWSYSGSEAHQNLNDFFGVSDSIEIIDDTITFYGQIDKKGLSSFSIEYKAKTYDFSKSQDGHDFRIDPYLKPIIDGERPAIDGQENFVTSVEESKDIKYFIDFIKAIDDIDGDISHLIQIETDNYTPNKRVLGKHEVKIYVEDNAGNRSDFTFFVNVVDITKPVITGNSDVVQIGYKETYNIENFRKTLKVTDNYDSLTNADIELKTDGYTSNKGKLGTWNVVFEAKDKSDNSTTFTKPIKVYDNIAPVFSGTKEVIKSYTKLMTLDEILKEVSVNDEIDGNITKITVESDTFTGNGNKVGSYEIKLSAKDNAGNIGYWTITVKVIDDQGANWWITNGVTVNLTPGATLTRTQIVELLAKTGQVAANKDAIVTYDVDTYSDNIGTPGLYTLGFTVKNMNGVSNSYTYGINVMDESNTDDENLDIKEDKTILEQAIKWITVGGIIIAITYGGYVVFFKNKKK